MSGRESKRGVKEVSEMTGDIKDLFQKAKEQKVGVFSSILKAQKQLEQARNSNVRA